ncbi:MAG: GldG family protein, partial [Firmicutes bacterium]|nr:GldG family protein [Bacillota bacterium]
MNKILKSFTDKRFKYGSYSTIIGIVVVAILIAVNLVVGQFELKYDLTDTGMYSISDTTKEIIGGLDKKVTIYALYKTGSEEAVFTELLDQYKNNSSNIEIVYKDPYLYPQFAQQYKTEEGEDISVNSLIVESEKRAKVIDASDMFESNYNPYTGEVQTTGIQFESVVTSAIKNVTMDKLPVIYNVTNHGEEAVPDRLKGQLETANYELKELDLFNIDEIPSDCTIIMMTTPKRDYSAQEAEVVKKYLAGDGRAIVLMNYTAENMPNMQSIISGYGVQADRAIIVEGDAQYCYQGRPTFLLPKLTEHNINSGITNNGYAML